MSNDGKQSDVVGSEGVEGPSEEIASFPIPPGWIMSGYQRIPADGDGTQRQHLTGDDGSIRGFKTNKFKLAIYILLNVILVGVPWLVSRWFSHLKVAWLCDRCALNVADTVEVTDVDEEKTVCKVVVEAVEFIPDEFASRSSTTLRHQDASARLCDPENSGTVYRYFIFHHEKYIWDDQKDEFKRIDGLVDITCHQLQEEFRGMSPNRRIQMNKIYGANEIYVEIKSYFKLLVDEVLNPFYIFQIFSVILWCFDEYYYYAWCVIAVSSFSIILSLYKTRKQSQILKEMAQGSGDVLVCVRTPTGEEEEISSMRLVPGDIILLPPEGCIMPCDAVITQGNCVVNESMLTGESVPVNKSAIVGSGDIFNCDTHKRHVVFGGTHVIQPRFYAGNKVACVVVRTGYSTLKGQLIRSILFPKEIGFEFYTDAMKFVFLLSMAALSGMAYCVYLYVKRRSTWYVVLVRVLDIVTIVVPPALPAAMTVGTLNAQSRLRKKGIFCISPQRINYCGKVKLVCFDKTGTLTEDGLSLSCIVPVAAPHEEGGIEEFSDPVSDPQQLPTSSNLLRGMATCHSLTYIKGNIVGDTLDMKMFESTGWVLEEPMTGTDATRFDVLTPNVVKKGDTEIGIIREFDFTPQLQRMSVVVRCLESTEMLAYCKGAPEKIRPLCNNVPEDYDKILDYFTVKGFRVIGLAWKKIEGVNWHQLQKMSRDKVESNLNFAGFLIMQNSLKPATMPVMKELTSAEIRCVMVTGDNMLTALSVARECGMVPPQDKVVIVNIKDDGSLDYTLAAQHCHSAIEEPVPNTSGFSNNNGERDDRHSDREAILPVEEDIGNIQVANATRRFSKRFSVGSSTSETLIDMEKLVPIKSKFLESSNYHFALTGKTWSFLYQNRPVSELQKILAKGAVFARMSPECKMQLVEAMQDIGYVVAMCGDGANDCSALSVAHVGISLSEAEASVAAPFTSKVADVSCVPKLLLEGRCALVTSFGIFKYMALYSMVQFASVLILYTYLTNLADKQFLWIDLAITTTITVAMGRTQPVSKLVSKRPMGSLVSFKNVFSIFSQILICVAVQIAGLELLKSQPWFTPVTPSTSDELKTQCWETTTIFSISSFQYLITSVVFSKGAPFRKPFYLNRILLGSTIVLAGSTAVMMVYPFPAISSFFELEPPSQASQNFRYILIAFPVVNFLVSAFFEYFIVGSKFIKGCGKRVWKSGPTLKYKEILDELESDKTWPPLTL